MTKKAKARGYFSQLAEPLPPGEPVLTARPGALPSVGPERSLVPMIEDRFEVAPSPWTPLSHEAWRARRETPVASTEPQTLEASARRADRTPAPLPRGEATAVAREGGRVTRQPAREGARRQPDASRNEAPAIATPDLRGERAAAQPKMEPAATVTATRGTSSASPLTPKEAAQEPDSEGGGGFNPRIKPAESARALAPERRSRPISPEAPSFSAAAKPIAAGGFRAEVKRAAPEPLEVAGENGAERKAAPEAAAAEKGRASVGSRVHIGTVEIRAALPQPPVERPIAAPFAQTRESRTAQARAQSGAAEPLARGLSWSYGLVQG